MGKARVLAQMTRWEFEELLGQRRIVRHYTEEEPSRRYPLCPWSSVTLRPLIHWAAIGRLALLRELYHKITIPAAVWREVVEEGGGRAGVREIETARQAAWVEIMSSVESVAIRVIRGSIMQRPVCSAQYAAPSVVTKRPWYNSDRQHGRSAGSTEGE